MLRRLGQHDFHHTLDDVSGVSLVLFTGPACGTCHRLKYLLRERADLFSDLHLFEVDAQQEMGLVREFEVFHLPGMFLFRDGQFHCQLHAPAVPEALRTAIDRALAGPAQEAP